MSLKARIRTVVDSYARRRVFRSARHVYCTFCEAEYLTFLPGGVAVKRANATCPMCGTLERDRLVWKFLKDQTGLFTASTKLLHVAPEKVFFPVFEGMNNLDYCPCAKFGEGYNDKYPSGTVDRDLTSMPEGDNTFDAIICSHVLEHIPDDHQAMSELFRILKPGGWAVLQVPLDRKRDKTYEDWDITSPEEREKAFGQDDHVRVYGRDYKDRLEAAGFEVKVINITSEMSRNDLFRHGFIPEDIYYCTKRA